MGCGVKAVNWQLLCEREMRGVSVEVKGNQGVRGGLCWGYSWRVNGGVQLLWFLQQEEGKRQSKEEERSGLQVG